MTGIRKAKTEDINYIEKIYNDILDMPNKTGWVKGVYPTKETAQKALEDGELFVMESDGQIAAAAKINKKQEKEYALVNWQFEAADNEVMVLHTLVVSPSVKGKGCGTQFVDFYENYARENGCKVLRMYTNVNNSAARALYKKLGFIESGVVGCVFNGIDGINLVCMEKKL